MYAMYAPVYEARKQVYVYVFTAPTPSIKTKFIFYNLVIRLAFLLRTRKATVSNWRVIFQNDLSQKRETFSGNEKNV
jgi:hypothetical protein